MGSVQLRKGRMGYLVSRGTVKVLYNTALVALATKVSGRTTKRTVAVLLLMRMGKYTWVCGKMIKGAAAVS